MARLVEIAEGDPGREVCGFLVRRGDGRREAVQLANVVEEHPGEGLRPSSRHAYLVDPAGHLALARRLRAEGGRIEAVFHSHVDGPARMSADDRRLAAVDGTSVLPGACHLILGLMCGKVREIRCFSCVEGEWRGEVIPLPVSVPEPPPVP